MRVTVCQIDPRPGFLESSMGAVGDHLADQDADLVLLPEMAFSEWLPAERTVDPARWAQSVRDHREWMSRLDDYGVASVLGTRPTVEATGSRRNEAFIWTEETGEPVAIPRATPRGSTDKWIAGGRVAAVCSGAYSLSSNLWLPEETSSADCGGVGWIIDPEGEVLATTSEERPCATAEIDLAVARHSKTTYPRYISE